MRLKAFFHHSAIPIARVLWTLSIMLSALCVSAQAQEAKKLPRVLRTEIQMKKNSGLIAQRSVRRAALCVMLFGLCISAEAQQSKRVPRIGYLTVASWTGSAHLTEALLQGLRELGYVEDRNIIVEYRWADGNFQKLPELAAELVNIKVDVMVTAVTQASLTAKNATGTIPIVMVAVANPVDFGLIASLARPGRISPGRLL